MKELSEEEKKEIDHMTECMRKIVLPDLSDRNKKKRKPKRKQGKLL